MGICPIKFCNPRPENCSVNPNRPRYGINIFYDPNLEHGWVPKQNCLGIGANVVEHDGCCGRYPERKPFVKNEKKCCNNVLTLSTIC